MKTYISNIIPALKKYSRKLDDTSMLTKEHWVVWNEDTGKKTVIIFSEKENLLRVSENGKTRKGRWEILGKDMIEIEVNGEAMLFRHEFQNDKLLALELDGTGEYALLVDEPTYQKYMAKIDKTKSVLTENYMHQLIDEIVAGSMPIAIELNQEFNPADYPSLKAELDSVKVIMQDYPKESAADIIISFAKDHSLKCHWFETNPQLAESVAGQYIELKVIEKLFDLSKENIDFQYQLQEYLRSEIERAEDEKS